MDQIINQPLPAGRRRNNPGKIIIHSMGEFIDIGEEDVFAVEWLRRSGISAHVFIDPYGRVFKCREDEQGAYHARGYNRDSLGLEFLVPGSHTYGSFLKAIKDPWLSDAQMESGLEVMYEWMATWSICKGDVVRHSEVSPGRKYDPGDGFPWNEFLARL